MRLIQPVASQTNKYSALVSHEQKAVWYKVRKCASISISNSLPGSDWITINNNRNVRQFASEYFGDYFRFAFVRNPFNRLVSNYLHKIKDKSIEQIRPSYIRNLQFHPTMSFEDFALQVCALPEEKCDRHYRSMYTSIDLDNIDFIGRLENLPCDFNYVVQQITGCKTAGVSHHNKQGRYDYREFYSTELQQNVAERYRVDLRLFGYDFDGIHRDDKVHDKLSNEHMDSDRTRGTSD